MSNFIGRGEELVEYVIRRLYEFTETWNQVPIKKLIKAEDFEQYGEEFSKHKFDIVTSVAHPLGISETLVITVNYKHKEKAAQKWSNNFSPDLIRNAKTPVTIDDYDCRSSIPKTPGLFYLNSKKEHGPITWNDFRDVIDALEKAGVQS